MRGPTRREFLAGAAGLGAALVAGPAAPALRTRPSRATPLKRLVFLMQENRSFDHYFGLFPGADGPPAAGPGGVKSQCLGGDLPHDAAGSAAELSRGFEAVAGAVSQLTYTGADLPYYWALAGRFTLCDRYFSSALGATFPNRLFSLAGSAGGFRDNPKRIDPALLPRPNLVDRLDEAGVSWACYQLTAPDAMYNPVAYYPERRSDPRAARSFAAFLRDAASGRLPAVSWIVSEDPLTEHPPAPAGWGERLAALAVNSVAAGPAWPETAVVITYDEHGGFADHVRPPGGHAAGFRVPALVVSPYAHPGRVSHAQLDHTSQIALVTAVFGLEPLGVDTAGPFEDCFDFGRPRPDWVAYPRDRVLPDCAVPPAWAREILSLPVPGGRPAPVPAARG